MKEKKTNNDDRSFRVARRIVEEIWREHDARHAERRREADLRKAGLA